MERPERREAGGRVPLGSDDPGERGQGPAENDAPPENPTEEVAEEAPATELRETGRSEEVADPDETRRRMQAKDWHIRELYDELATLRLVSDEARARAEAGELRVGDLEEERARLKERSGALEEEERRQRRRREGQDRRVARLERELERREAEIQRLEDLLESKEEEMDAYGQEARGTVSRKDAALENALRRVEGLQRDLEERENEVVELRSAVDELQDELDLEYERRQRMAEPANRLRAGIDLFNDSEHLRSVDSISKSLGHPEVHVALGDGSEPPVVLTFAWGNVTRQTYVSNPGLAVEEPRVYQTSAGESPGREPPNARIGPGGRVFLGL